MANGFGFPKQPQQKSPNPQMVGELLAQASGRTPPPMGGALPAQPGHPHPGSTLRPSGSGLPTQPNASNTLSPFLGARK